MTDHLNALPGGYRFEEYEIVRLLGSGGFGLTYLGYDHNLDKPVAIKEYLPNDMAVRGQDSTVLPKSTADKEDFDWGLDRFLMEARTLARFDNPHLIKVFRFFRAHGTGYIVMEYAEGETFSEYLTRHGTIGEDKLKAILLPLLSGLEEVHKADFLHRDIKPGNIMIREGGSPVLIDFGAARQAVGAKSRSVTSIVTPGYAPIEQYDTKGNQGPWTDIYALGAVAYKALTGNAPDDATGRVRRDPMIPAVRAAKAKGSAAFLAAIDAALEVDEPDRPQSVAAWRKSLLAEVAEAPAPKPKPKPKPAKPKQPKAAAPTPKPKKAKSKGSFKSVAAMMLLFALSVGAFVYSGDLKEQLAADNYEQDQADYEIARSTNTIAAYGAYVRSRPSGQFRASADSAAWAIANAAGTPTALEAYLRYFGSGNRSQQARTVLDGLRDTAFIRRIQGELRRTGYSSSAPDGVAGPQTSRAIRQFQSSNGLTVDGEVSKRLEASLRSASAKNVWTVAKDGSGDGSTIGAVIRMAPKGSRIRILPGTYNESLRLTDTYHLEGIGARRTIRIVSKNQNTLNIRSGSGSIKNVTVRSTDLEQNYPTIWIDKGNYTIDGVDGTNAKTSVITVNGGSPTIRNSVLHNSKGAGILIQSSAAGVYEDNEFYATESPALYISGTASPTVRRNYFHDITGNCLNINETAKGSYEQNRFVNCGKSNTSAIYIAKGTSARVTRNTLSGGDGARIFRAEGSGGSCFNNNAPTETNCN